MQNIFVLTGPDGAGKTTIWKNMKKELDWKPWLLFCQFPTPEIKESLIKLDEPMEGSITRHKVFETDFEYFRLENKDKNVTAVLDRFYIDNMAYCRYFNPHIPLDMFDLTPKFNHTKINIVHISPNSTLWKEKYNHDELHEEFKDLIDICYQEVFLYLVSRYTNIKVKVIYNRYDGQAEKEVYDYFQNVYM